MKSFIRPLRFAAVILSLTTLSLALAACGGGGGGSKNTSTDITPIPGNSELDVGPNRFALALIDKDNHPILEAAGTSVHLRFLFGGQSQQETDATFTWAIPNVNGFFVANVNFDKAGAWQVEATLTRNGATNTVTLPLRVQAKSQVPNVGDPAPPSANLTLVTQSNALQVTTDQSPDQALYQMTVADAIKAHKPFVVIFATPAFCQTRFCGPMVDNVKQVRQQFAGRVNFIHIEPYELSAEGKLVTDSQGATVPAQPTVEWNLQTEPWVFVVGADGRIAARFEGAASPAEMTQAIQQALGQSG